jgi:hypothetical protein
VIQRITPKIQLQLAIAFTTAFMATAFAGTAVAENGYDLQRLPWKYNEYWVLTQQWNGAT